MKHHFTCASNNIKHNKGAEIYVSSRKMTWLYTNEWIFLSQNRLVMSKQLYPHPAPEVEEDVDRDGDRQQQAVETQAAATGATLRKVLIHCGRVKQTKERHYGD